MLPSFLRGRCSSHVGIAQDSNSGAIFCGSGEHLTQTALLKERSLPGYLGHPGRSRNEAPEGTERHDKADVCYLISRMKKDVRLESSFSRLSLDHPQCRQTRREAPQKELCTPLYTYHRQQRRLPDSGRSAFELRSSMPRLCPGMQVHRQGQRPRPGAGSLRLRCSLKGFEELQVQALVDLGMTSRGMGRCSSRKQDLRSRSPVCNTGISSATSRRFLSPGERL